MKILSIKSCLIVALLGIIQVTVNAGTDKQDYTLRFKSGDFLPNEKQYSSLVDLSGNSVDTAIVQFYTLPSAQELAKSGYVPLYYVPNNAVIAQLPDHFKPSDDPNIRWVGSLTREQKISPRAEQAMLRNSSQREHYLVYFFSNSGSQSIDAVIQSRGLSQQKIDGLPNNVRVIEMNSAQVSGVADLANVFWLMPAPQQLMVDSRVGFCLGPVSQYGPIPNFVAATDGWDGPGLGSSDLLYHFVNDTPDIGGVLEYDEFRDAFAEWARHADLSFTETALANQNSSFDILFGAGNHGDPFPFDGPNGVLAHAYYSPTINPDPIAGDMHFDEDETWRIGANFDMFSVALHEAGHSLGLNHTDVPGSVMLPIYAGVVTELAADDIAGIQSIYAPAPTGSDLDNDGIDDNADNCIERANTDQRDTDGDGYGNTCDADLNNDRIVNFLDLGLMQAVFFTSDPDADFNGDGFVNFLDLGIMKLLFFEPPGPSAVGMLPPSVPTLSINADGMGGGIAFDIDGNFEVVWNRPADAVTFNLQRYREVPTGSNLTEFNGLTLTFKLETNRPNGLYEYRVQACDANGLCSAFSAGSFVEVDRF